MSRRLRSFRHGGPRRKTTWEDAFWFNPQTNDVTSGNSLIYTQWVKLPADIAIPTLGGREPVDYTLTRSYIRFTGAIGAGPTEFLVNVYIAAGLIVWDGLNADPPDVLSVQPPISNDDDADWIWKWVWPVTILDNGGNLTGAYTLEPGLESGAWSRAQRKLSAHQGLLLVVQCRNEGEIDVGFNWTYYSRHLFKLP